MADYPTTPAPMWPIREEREWNTVIFEAENGSEQRDQKWENSRAHFYLSYNVMDSATIWNFIQGKHGRADSFTFNPHDFDPVNYSDENITVRFGSDTPARTIPYGGGLQVLEVELVEVK